MAKLDRIYQKVFGKNGGAIGVFGSAQANSPASGTLTTDPAAVQSLAAYEEGWASASIGGTRRPTQEEFDGLNFVNTRQLSYLFQEGIAVWDVSTEYHENSLVKEDGTTNIYKSITDNNTGNPLSDIANWQYLTDFDIKQSQNIVIINSLADFPAPVAGVITLEDYKCYMISGEIDIGTNRIVFGINNSIVGQDPETDILKYTGTGDMITAVNQNVVLFRIGTSCDAGTLFNATNIDYTIDPNVDRFQGRSKRFLVNTCNIVGGTIGNGSKIGSVEGFATINMNGNFIKLWDDGIEVSNALSFELLSGKVVFFNQQGGNLIIIRDSNWTNQTNTPGSYAPLGFNALNINGSIIHPRGPDYGLWIQEGSIAKTAVISGNIFETTGLTTGGIFNPAGLSYNDLPTYIFQSNVGADDNTPTTQLTIDSPFPASDAVTTTLTQNTPTKINLGNVVRTSENLLFSSRLLVTDATNFEVDQIITGGTSGYTAKIQSIDLSNNYLYVQYVIDGVGDNQYFTVGETITSLTASTTYNGVDGTLKYYADQPLSSRILCTLTFEKTGGGNDLYRALIRVNGVNQDNTSSYLQLNAGAPIAFTLQALQDLEKDDIIEIYVENTSSNDDVICQFIVLNISGR